MRNWVTPLYELMNVNFSNGEVASALTCIREQRLACDGQLGTLLALANSVLRMPLTNQRTLGTAGVKSLAH